jgi:hypothetical protein
MTATIVIDIVIRIGCGRVRRACDRGPDSLVTPTVTAPVAVTATVAVTAPVAVTAEGTAAVGVDEFLVPLRPRHQLTQVDRLGVRHLELGFAQ